MLTSSNMIDGAIAAQRSGTVDDFIVKTLFSGSESTKNTINNLLAKATKLGLATDPALALFDKNKDGQIDDSKTLMDSIMGSVDLSNPDSIAKFNSSLNKIVMNSVEKLGTEVKKFDTGKEVEDTFMKYNGTINKIMAAAKKVPNWQDMPTQQLIDTVLSQDGVLNMEYITGLNNLETVNKTFADMGGTPASVIQISKILGDSQGGERGIIQAQKVIKDKADVVTIPQWKAAEDTVASIDKKIHDLKQISPQFPNAQSEINTNIERLNRLRAQRVIEEQSRLKTLQTVAPIPSIPNIQAGSRGRAEDRGGGLDPNSYAAMIKAVSKLPPPTKPIPPPPPPPKPVGKSKASDSSSGQGSLTVEKVKKPSKGGDN